jgi:hypothetical protein
MTKDLKEVLVSLVSVCQQLVIHQTLVSGLLTEKLPSEESSTFDQVTLHDAKKLRKDLAALGRKIAAMGKP